MVVVLVTREIAVTGLRAMAAAEGQVMAAEELGKYKMALQSIAIQGLLFITFISTWIFSRPGCSCCGSRWR